MTSAVVIPCCTHHHTPTHPHRCAPVWLVAVCLRLRPHPFAALPLVCAPWQAMMAALLHWSQARWLALAGDMRAMGLLKPSTDLQELADDLALRFQQLYAAADKPAAADTAAAVPPAAAAASGRRSANSSPGGSSALLLQRAGAIGFAEFAGVIAALALKYRFELPPYFTLIIRSLTTLEGFALLVDPCARQSIARTAVKVSPQCCCLARCPVGVTAGASGGRQEGGTRLCRC